MSFCQKHLNHHCQHAHHCPHPSHPRKASQGKTPSKCTFEGGYIARQCLSNQEATDDHQNAGGHDHKNAGGHYHRSAGDQGRLLLASEEASRKLGLENTHLFSQIEYYRQQFASLIGSSSTDAKNEIKKRLKETTELILRVKSLEGENSSLSNQNEGLRRFIHDDKLSRMKNKQVNGQLEDKYNATYHQLRAVDHDKQDLRGQLQARGKELTALTQKHHLLSKEFTFECEAHRKETRDLGRELEGCQKQLNKVRGNNLKNSELSTLDRDTTQKREEMLKAKLGQFELKNRELAQTVEQLRSQCEELTEDLSHAKVVLEKKTQNSQEVDELQRELGQQKVETRTLENRTVENRAVENRTLESKTVSRERRVQFNKENGDDQAGSQALLLQISWLKSKVSQLQKSSCSDYESVILNMGASQAFRRLVQQKNQVIKRLMREKGQIYAKVALG